MREEEICLIPKILTGQVLHIRVPKNRFAPPHLVLLCLVACSTTKMQHVPEKGSLHACNAPQAEAGATPNDAGIPDAEVPLARSWSHDVLRSALPGVACDDAQSCLREAFAEDRESLQLALKLLGRYDSLTGVEPAQTMDGGFRGAIQLVPTLPVGADRRYLLWVDSALSDFAVWKTRLSGSSISDVGATQTPLSYRSDQILFRFMRSVGRTTPSAWATTDPVWSIAINVRGSLLKNEDAFRETLFHELFHLHDQTHNDWSSRTLTKLHEEIQSECGMTSRATNEQKNACLTKFAPGTTKVRGGVYYAFQPNNGVNVREYAAELALRFYLEHRKLQRGEPIAAPFKCAHARNQRAWSLLSQEFFGGIDRVSCTNDPK